MGILGAVTDIVLFHSSYVVGAMIFS